MSTNNSDLGSTSGLGMGFSLDTSHGLTSRQQIQQHTGNFGGEDYSFGPASYGAGTGGGLARSGSSSTLAGNQPMFVSVVFQCRETPTMSADIQIFVPEKPSPKDVHDCDSPLFGTDSESLCK